MKAFLQNLELALTAAGLEVIFGATLLAPAAVTEISGGLQNLSEESPNRWKAKCARDLPRAE